MDSGGRTGYGLHQITGVQVESIAMERSRRYNTDKAEKRRK